MRLFYCKKERKSIYIIERQSAELLEFDTDIKLSLGEGNGLW
jgi:hypothetical protein